LVCSIGYLRVKARFFKNGTHCSIWFHKITPALVLKKFLSVSSETNSGFSPVSSISHIISKIRGSMDVLMLLPLILWLARRIEFLSYPSYAYLAFNNSAISADENLCRVGFYIYSLATECVR
jgi:hypothetical protein